MPQPPSATRVTLDNLISEHDRKIGFLESTTKSLNDRLDSMNEDMHGMRTEFKDGLAVLATEFRQTRATDENNRRPQYGLLISVVFGVATVGFGFTALVTQPLRDNDGALTHSLEQTNNIVMEQSSELGELRVSARTNKGFIDGLAASQDTIKQVQMQNVDRLSRVEGVQDYMKEHLRDVDGAGSRKWIDGKATDTQKPTTGPTSP